MRHLLAFVLIIVALVATARAQTEVDLELVLLVDASNSIDNRELQFQRQGYADALTHPDVLDAIGAGLLGRIAITFMEWADDDSQDVVVPWTIIYGAASAKAFSGKLLKADRRAFGSNAIGEAIAAGQRQIEGNDIIANRRVIDFSGDSANNFFGRPIHEAREAALAAGMTINGLAILCRDVDCSGRPVGYNLEEAYRNEIAGGPGSFVITVDSRSGFARAVRRKLILEISDLCGRNSAVAECQISPRRRRSASSHAVKG